MAENKNPERVPVTLHYAPGLVPQLRLGDLSTWTALEQIKAVFAGSDYDARLVQLALGLALVALEPSASQTARDNWALALWDHIADTSGRGALARGAHVVGVASVRRGKPWAPPTPRHRRLPTPQKRRRATFDPETYTDGVPEIVKAARTENAQGRMLN